MKQLQAMEQAWNEKAPVGTAVSYCPDLNPDAPVINTKTRSVAWILGGHAVVVMIEGVAGCYAIEKLTIVDTAQ